MKLRLVYKQISNRKLLTSFMNCNVIKDKKSKPLFLSLTAIDITERKEAEQQIRSSLAEKVVLLNEIHHRVKNNMQIISSLLSMQVDNIDNKEYIDIFNANINRIKTMSQIHEILYQSKDFTKIDFSDYINKISENIISLYIEKSERISLKTDIGDIYLKLDTAIPCGLIINELLTNSYKHAFPGKRKGAIKVSMKKLDDETIELRVSDNGKGIPRSIDTKNSGTMGLRIINLLVQQLEGKFRCTGTRTKGTEFRITFKGD